MREEQNEKMRWILFWIFIGFYVVITILTILALFFGLGNLTEGYKNTLFTTFIIETGVGVIALFYALFGLKKAGEKETPEVHVQTVESDEKSNVKLVEDLPYKGVLDLNKHITLPEMYADNFRSLLDKQNFAARFKPNMYVFVSPDTAYQYFRPNVVIQTAPNQLTQLNITLADYMDSVFSETQKLQSIVGKRYIRIGANTATQWYEASASRIMGLETEMNTTFQQIQKVVVTDSLMGIITISYSDETTPQDQSILQQLLEEFGVK